jgi:hypothetical protein
LRDDLKELFKNKSLVIVIIAFTIRFMAGYSRGFFEPMVFHYNYPDKTLEYAIANTIILILAPLPGFFYVSKYTDQKEKTDARVRPFITSITLLIPVIFFPIMYYCSTFWLSIACVFVVYTIGEIYLPIGFVIMLNITTPRVRAL